MERRRPVESGDDERRKQKPRASEEDDARKKRAVAMDPMLWHKVAAVSGVAALGLGTYGAHMFRPKNPAYKEVWHTASLYHLVHTAALLGAPVTKHPNVFGGLLTAGIVLFSGTCYTVAYLEDRKYSSTAPLGGFAFIAAWASLLF
ncbi:transmembrane protein 256 homolog [Oryza brachyantha]|uniref:transmembrane protein 256 homolog n=1 Tax=Oryza brachyantha TaxID=4533 RepID=UPI000776A171|nr:transmembrane protein 256 homolog [Oryza brachyantha]